MVLIITQILHDSLRLDKIECFVLTPVGLSLNASLEKGHSYFSKIVLSLQNKPMADQRLIQLLESDIWVSVSIIGGHHHHHSSTIKASIEESSPSYLLHFHAFSFYIYINKIFIKKVDKKRRQVGGWVMDQPKVSKGKRKGDFLDGSEIERSPYGLWSVLSRVICSLLGWDHVSFGNS